ncbi:MAG: capsular biosynthesis protein [Bacteroidetes bacterium]|nr:capsular biosynthesis protein [Bacteroidota bacterium]
MGLFSNLFKKKEILSNLTDLSGLGVDLHSHLIPGIDDGAKTMEESLILIKGLADLGFRKIITSPHIMSGGYNNTPEIILNGRDMVRQALKEAAIDVAFDAWAEYYLDETIMPKIEKRNLLTMGDNYVLVELSYLMKSFSTTSYFYNLISNGYKVVLAHPERYPYYYSDELDEYKMLKDQGVYFQLNISSLTGTYGDGARSTAQKLIDSDMIDFVATDLHNMRHLNYIRQAVRLPYVEKVIGYDKLLNKVFL